MVRCGFHQRDLPKGLVRVIDSDVSRPLGARRDLPPRGGVISPCLSNVFLRYVLDEWFETEVRPRLKGESTLARFADDAIKEEW